MSQNKFLSAIHFFLPVVGSLYDAWRDSEVPEEAPNEKPRAKKLRIQKKRKWELSRNAALAVGVTTIPLALLMKFCPELFTLNGFDGFGHIAGTDISFRELANISGSDIEHLDGMLLSCVLAFIILPWIIKGFTHFLHFRSTIEDIDNNFQSQKSRECAELIAELIEKMKQMKNDLTLLEKELKEAPDNVIQLKQELANELKGLEKNPEDQDVIKEIKNLRTKIESLDKDIQEKEKHIEILTCNIKLKEEQTAELKSQQTNTTNHRSLEVTYAVIQEQLNTPNLSDEQKMALEEKGKIIRKALHLRNRPWACGHIKYGLFGIPVDVMTSHDKTDKKAEPIPVKPVTSASSSSVTQNDVVAIVNDPDFETQSAADIFREGELEREIKELNMNEKNLEKEELEKKLEQKQKELEELRQPGIYEFLQGQCVGL